MPFASGSSSPSTAQAAREPSTAPATSGLGVVVQKWNEWLQSAGSLLDPLAGYSSRRVSVRHGQFGLDEDYELELHHPHDFDWEGLRGGDGSDDAEANEPAAGDLYKAVGSETASAAGSDGKSGDSLSGGRWVTVHPNGSEAEGHPVYIKPNPDGTHTIVAGAGGKLNGLRLHGVKSEAEYTRLAGDRRQERIRQARVERETRRQQMGVEAFARLEGEKKVARDEAGAAKTGAERELIRAVLEAKGMDSAALMEVPPERLAGLDSKTAARVQQRLHSRLLAFAHAAVDQVKDVVVSGIGDMAKDAAGDLAAGDLASVTLGGTTLGYAAGKQRLAEEHGLDVAAARRVAEDAAWQSLLGRTDFDVFEAAARKDSTERRQAGRKRAEAKVQQAAGRLAGAGVGPEAVKQLADQETPPVADLGQATAILVAAKKARAAAQAAGAFGRALDVAASADDVAKLPKAALVVTGEMSDADAKSAVAAELGHQARTRAVSDLADAANRMETEAPGSLREHYSVGQGAAFSALSLAVGSGPVDPLLVDTLGAAGAAQVLAHAWRKSLDPVAFEAAKTALADQHVATQEKIASDGTRHADALLDQAEQIAEPETYDSPEALAAGVAAHGKKVALLAQAREAAGVARGRLEAAAAMNDALMKGGSKENGGAGDVTLSLGPRSLTDAALDLGALGLTHPAKHDNDGKEVEAGEYTLRSDGQGNAFAILHPMGLDRLAASLDPRGGSDERARASEAIKRGAEDDPHFHPAGITDRPRTTWEVDPSLFVQSGAAPVLRIGPDADESAMAGKIGEHVGALIQEGQAPFDALAAVSSEVFIAGLDLSPEARGRFEAALRQIAPPAPPPKAGATAGEKVEAFRAHRDALEAKLRDLGDAYAENDPSATALDKQTLGADAVTRDCWYTALLSEPRARWALQGQGGLSEEDARTMRADTRAWAYEHLWGMNAKQARESDEPITPLSPDERHAYDAWRELSEKHGEPYAAVQAHWRDASAQDTGLFDDAPPEPHPFAAVDLGNRVAVLETARTNARALGYATLPDGSAPELSPTENRSEETIAGDARARLRQQIRAHFLSEMAGRPDLAASGFNPAGVRTASERWAEYVKNMGGEKRALGAVHELMLGQTLPTFAAAYKERTGRRLNLARRTLTHAQAHAEAMLGAEGRAALGRGDKRLQAQLTQGAGGRFQTGSVGEKKELHQEAEQSQQSRLFAGDDQVGERTSAQTRRASLGRAAEKTLAALTPHLSLSRPVEAAQGVTFADEAGLRRQRAIKLIARNERQGACLQAGGGKSLVGIAGFTQARADGKAKRAMFVVPSNIVAQFGSEFYKFVDPSAGLTWHADPGASGEERGARFADPDTHVCVVTPEALRGDVTQAVAEDLGMTPGEATEHLAGLGDGARDRVIHQAMGSRGWDFDYTLLDEAHRMLGRAGKPDAHMARVADSVSRKSRFLVYSTADPVKNDASECFDVLHKLDPARYSGEEAKAAFLRRYGRNTPATKLALQREMAPYVYATPVNVGATHSRQVHVLPLTDGERTGTEAVEAAYQKARKARRAGSVDVEALKVLAPGSFGKGEADEATGARLGNALGTLRETALNRAVNLNEDGAKLRWLLGDKAQNKPGYLNEHRGEPAIVFAHNRQAVKMISERLQAAGHRVGRITGEMSGDAKEQARLAFHPGEGKEAAVDVLVCSDAAAMGANLQRGYHLINWDTPQTAMLHEQRIAREWRTGQKNHVNVHDLVADCDYEHRARKRLADKKDLRETLTTPAEAIDDSGLSLRLEQEMTRAYRREYERREAVAA